MTANLVEIVSYREAENLGQAEAGVIRRNSGNSSSLISRMLANAWPSGMPLQWVRNIRKFAPVCSRCVVPVISIVR